MPSRNLVPGDLIELKLGDIVPADAILLEGQPVQVDQAALTGESLPVTIHSGGKVKQGSALKRGEIEAIVCATGASSVGTFERRHVGTLPVVGVFGGRVVSGCMHLCAFEL